MSTKSTEQAKPQVPDDIIYRWYRVLELVNRELKTPLSLITKLVEGGPQLVYVQTEGDNPFLQAGADSPLLDLEREVLSQSAPPQSQDLSANTRWSKHPLLAAGLRYHLGLPLRWPDGELFGTLAIYDSHPNAHASSHQALLAEFAHELEQELVILQQQQALKSEVARRRQAEAELANFTPKEFHALWHAAQAVLAHNKFDVAARVIFDEACAMTGATAGYVALLSDDGSENEVLFLESGGTGCSVDPRLPMPIRGLRAESYHSGKAVYHNDFMASEWTEYLPAGHVILNNVMFAPLNVDGRTVGIMGLANKPEPFTEFDATVAGAFGEVASIALRNSRSLDRLDETNRRLEQFNQSLVEREMRIIEVKQEVNALCRELGREPNYPQIAASLDQ